MLLLIFKTFPTFIGLGLKSDFACWWSPSKDFWPPLCPGHCLLNISLAHQNGCAVMQPFNDHYRPCLLLPHWCLHALAMKERFRNPFGSKRHFLNRVWGENGSLAKTTDTSCAIPLNFPYPRASVFNHLLWLGEHWPWHGKLNSWRGCSLKHRWDINLWRIVILEGYFKTS